MLGVWSSRKAFDKLSAVLKYELSSVGDFSNIILCGVIRVYTKVERSA